jgi:hypothetical protein
MWAHKEGGQSEHKAIERSEIRGTLSGAIADQELMLEQQRLRSDTAGAARAEEFREGDQQVDRQEKQIAHESNVITSANLRKTVRERLIGLELTNSHPTGSKFSLS